MRIHKLIACLSVPLRDLQVEFVVPKIVDASGDLDDRHQSGGTGYCMRRPFHVSINNLKRNMEHICPLSFDAAGLLYL